MAAAIASCVFSVHFLGSSAMGAVYLRTGNLSRLVSSSDVQESVTTRTASRQRRPGRYYDPATTATGGAAEAPRAAAERATEEAPVDRASDDRQRLPRAEARHSHRRRWRWRNYSITGIAGLTLLAGQCAPQQCAPAPPSATAPAAVQQVDDLTNQRRAERGLPALAVNQALMNAAQGHSADQAARDWMGHQGS